MSVVIFLNQIMDKRDNFICFSKTWMKETSWGKNFHFIMSPPLINALMFISIVRLLDRIVAVVVMLS